MTITLPIEHKSIACSGHTHCPSILHCVGGFYLRGVLKHIDLFSLADLKKPQLSANHVTHTAGIKLVQMRLLNQDLTTTVNL